MTYHYLDFMYGVLVRWGELNKSEFLPDELRASEFDVPHKTLVNGFTLLRFNDHSMIEEYERGYRSVIPGEAKAPGFYFTPKQKKTLLDATPVHQQDEMKEKLFHDYDEDQIFYDNELVCVGIWCGHLQIDDNMMMGGETILNRYPKFKTITQAAVLFEAQQDKLKNMIHGTPEFFTIADDCNCCS